MSPESAISLPWRNIFRSPYFEENLALVAIDEAHCIPEWYEYSSVIAASVCCMKPIPDLL